VPSTAEKERVFANVTRLRDAQRRLPDDEGLALVLADLERELGPTVSRSLAAKLLGVSHTGLQRWIDKGDLPLVIDRDGRTRVPVGVLLRLYDELRRQQDAAPRTRHVLEPLMLEGRRRAERIAPPTEEPNATDGHSRATRRARAYHAAIAKRLRRADVEEARRQLRRWELEGRIDPRYATAWHEVLDQPVVDIKRTLVETTRHADDLRQNSPFAGLLSDPERRRIAELVR
jgi:hypothetical protein